MEKDNDSITEEELKNEIPTNEKNEKEKEEKVRLNPFSGGFTFKIIKYCFFIVLFIVIEVVSIFGFIKYKEDITSTTENATVNYTVFLKENNFYKDIYLGEDLEYITNITDFIRLDYNYSMLYQTSLKKEVEYYISSRLDFIKDNVKNLYNDEKQLTETKKVTLDGNVLTIVESIDLPIQEYNSYIENYVNEYGIMGDANLKVSLFIKDDGVTREVSSVTLPLKEQTYHIDKNEIVNKTELYRIKNNNKYKYAFFASSLFFGLLLLYITIKFIKFIKKGFNNESLYEHKLNQILNTYDKVIVTLKNNNTIANDNHVYTVDSFLELLDVRDTIDKPILYYKVNNVKSEFYVQDIDKTYKYTLKEADLDKTE